MKRRILGDDEPKDDGSFWMQWEDFVVFWKDVQVAWHHTRRTRCTVQIESCVAQPKVVDCDTNIRTVAMPDYDEEMLFLIQFLWMKGVFTPNPKEPAITEIIG